jgi:hypothetical protein
MIRNYVYMNLYSYDYLTAFLQVEKSYLISLVVPFKPYVGGDGLVVLSWLTVCWTT